MNQASDTVYDTPREVRTSGRVARVQFDSPAAAWNTLLTNDPC